MVKMVMVMQEGRTRCLQRRFITVGVEHWRVLALCVGANHEYQRAPASALYISP